MARILVTGGAGFLGSHLCERLLEQGHRVFCLDNFFTGSRDNITHLGCNPGFAVIEADISRGLAMPDVDQIYNLACPASPVHYKFNPVQTVLTCVQGAIHVLELARKLNCPVLQASTSEVYGDPEIHPQVENYFGNVNPIGPRSCYDEGKRCAETLFFDYHRQFGVKIRIVRIFNTYGPRMHFEDGRVVSNFVLQALKGEDLTIYGKGDQTRSFCYVDDLISGLILAMRSEHTGPINLGNPEEITVLDLAQNILQLTGSKSGIIHQPQSENDPRRRKPDIGLAGKVLNWYPSISFREGLNKTILDFSQRLASTVAEEKK